MGQTQTSLNIASTIYCQEMNYSKYNNTKTIGS